MNPLIYVASFTWQRPKNIIINIRCELYQKGLRITWQTPLKNCSKRGRRYHKEDRGFAGLIVKKSKIGPPEILWKEQNVSISC